MPNTTNTFRESPEEDVDPISRFSGRKYLKVAGGLLLVYSFWFCVLILVLRWYNPPFTAFTLQEDWGRLNQERYNLRENWVSSTNLPDHLKLAVIASEDQRFYSHWGLDLAAIEKAVEENEQGKRVRGASTITQQVAKNLFLSPAQSYLRKGIEAGIAVLIEILWSKDRIIEVYLNIAEFGPGVYGVEKAAGFWFNKNSTELTSLESARLATVLPNPKLIKADPASDYVANRSRWILRNMEQLSGLQYLPKPKPMPDTSDTVQNMNPQMDSLSVGSHPDSLDMSNSFLQTDSSILENLSLEERDSLPNIDLPDSLLTP